MVRGGSPSIFPSLPSIVSVDLPHGDGAQVYIQTLRAGPDRVDAAHYIGFPDLVPGPIRFEFTVDISGRHVRLMVPFTLT